MSYESMAREAIGCDFPECPDNFDDSGVMRNAIIRNNDIAAFCRTHSALLLNEGVNLRLLKDVQREWLARGGRGAKEDEKEAHQRRVREFIAGLK